jgi:hypothetical protein
VRRNDVGKAEKLFTVPKFYQHPQTFPPRVHDDWHESAIPLLSIVVPAPVRLSNDLFFYFGRFVII